MYRGRSRSPTPPRRRRGSRSNSPQRASILTWEQINKFLADTRTKHDVELEQITNQLDEKIGSIIKNASQYPIVKSFHLKDVNETLAWQSLKAKYKQIFGTCCIFDSDYSDEAIFVLLSPT